jgi:hypothetical protein
MYKDRGQFVTFPSQPRNGSGDALAGVFRRTDVSLGLRENEVGHVSWLGYNLVVWVSRSLSASRFELEFDSRLDRRCVIVLVSVLGLCHRRRRRRPGGHW